MTTPIATDRQMALLNDFERAVDFSFWREICETQGTLRRYRRGEYFVREGDVLRFCGWIKSGGFKHTLIDGDGNRKTVGFVFENSVLANYVSGFLGRRMPTDIIALKSSDVYVVPTSIIKDRLESDPKLNLKMVQSLFEQSYRTMLDSYRISAYDSYMRLTSRCPRIFELVPLNEIASYLNISLRQLHRFRKS